jgi:hypothetical protein
MVPVDGPPSPALAAVIGMVWAMQLVASPGRRRRRAHDRPRTRVVVTVRPARGRPSAGSWRRLQVAFVELDVFMRARLAGPSRARSGREVAALLAACSDGWSSTATTTTLRPRAAAHRQRRLASSPFPVRMRGWMRTRAGPSMRSCGTASRNAPWAFLSPTRVVWGVTAWRPHHRAADARRDTAARPLYELRSPRAVRRFLDAVADVGSRAGRAP